MRYVFDMDGVLADIHRREPLIPDWDAFFDPQNMALDAPIEPVLEIVRLLVAVGHPVTILTARPERTREVTHQWLVSHLDIPLIQEIDLVMRPDGDHAVRTAAEWKLSILDTQKYAEPLAFFDDRKRNAQAISLIETAQSFHLELV